MLLAPRFRERQQHAPTARTLAGEGANSYDYGHVEAKRPSNNFYVRLKLIRQQ